MYTFVSVIYMRLENIPGFEFFHGALHLEGQLFHSSPLSGLAFPLLFDGFGGETLAWEFKWTNNSFETEIGRRGLGRS